VTSVPPRSVKSSAVSKMEATPGVEAQSKAAKAATDKERRDIIFIERIIPHPPSD